MVGTPAGFTLASELQHRGGFCPKSKYLQRVLRPWITKLGESDLTFALFSCLVRFGDVKEEELRRHDGAGSDGYLAHIFRHAAKELFNEDVGEVTYRALRCVGLGRPLSICLCGQHCLSGVNSIIGPPARYSQLQV